jgi:hypothetical protein
MIITSSNICSFDLHDYDVPGAVEGLGIAVSEEMSKMEITEFEEVLKHLDISGNADSGKLTAS